MKMSPTLAIVGLVSAFAISPASAGDGWVTDFEEAKASAAAEGKRILVNITGSDW